MATSDLDPGVLKALKQLQPFQLRLYLTDGETKMVAIPGKRTRWARVAAILNSQEPAWVKAEALDGRGVTLGVVDNPELETDLAPFEDGGLEDIGGDGATVGVLMGQLRSLQGIMLQGQDVALKRQTELVRTTLDANRQLIEVMVKLVTGFAARLEKSEERAADFFDQLSQLAGGEEAGSEAGAVLQMLPQLLQVGAAKPAPTPAPNGARPGRRKR
jgi:hypothetical protein